MQPTCKHCRGTEWKCNNGLTNLICDNCGKPQLEPRSLTFMDKLSYRALQAALMFLVGYMIVESIRMWMS